MYTSGQGSQWLCKVFIYKDGWSVRPKSALTLQRAGGVCECYPRNFAWARKFNAFILLGRVDLPVARCTHTHYISFVFCLPFPPCLPLPPSPFPVNDMHAYRACNNPHTLTIPAPGLVYIIITHFSDICFMPRLDKFNMGIWRTRNGLAIDCWHQTWLRPDSWESYACAW